MKSESPQRYVGYFPAELTADDSVIRDVIVFYTRSPARSGRISRLSPTNAKSVYRVSGNISSGRDKCAALYNWRCIAFRSRNELHLGANSVVNGWCDIES